MSKSHDPSSLASLQSGDAELDALPALKPVAGRVVTWRGVLLGLIGVGLISALTPYNNYVLNNTGLIGSYLPVGLVMFMLAFHVLVNAPLHRFAPRYALSHGELAVALGMILVGCSFPSGGFMRYIPGHLVAFFYQASERPVYAHLMHQLHLPDWLFPSFVSSDPAARGHEAVVRQFYSRIPLPANAGFIARFMAVPWSAWLRPAAAWGAFAAALLGAVLCLSSLFHRQWVENERLTFPLATIYLSLIETPEKGHAFGRMLRSRLFQCSFVAIFFVHGLNALSTIYPRYVPAIPLGFNLRNVTAQPPFSYLDYPVVVQKISFAVVGTTFFVQGSVALSIWFFFLASQVVMAVVKARGGLVTEPMQDDQIFGALIFFGITILWVARAHLMMVVRQMFLRRGADEPRGEYLPYWVSGWGLFICLGALVGWLCAAGASVIGAVVLVLMIVLIYVVLAKVVAETGLLYVLIPVPLTRPWTYMMSGWGGRTTLPSYFFSSFFSGALTRDLREASPVYVTHALRVADEDVAGSPRTGHRFIGALVMALIVGFLVAGAATLYVHYSYASTLDQTQATPIDTWATRDMPRSIAMDPAIAYASGAQSHATYSSAEHFAFGAALTTALSILRLRYAGWPFHPVGFLLCYTWSIQMIWASVFVGWLAKAVILRFGGGKAYRAATPFFLGLIFGEMTAAGFWLIFSAICAMLGVEYQAIRILPY